MMFLPRLTFGVVLALAIAGLFGVVRAAEPTPPAQHRGASFAHSHNCADMDARMAAHQAFIEVKLGLTESQKADFKRLNESMKAVGEPMRKACTEQTAKTEAQTLPARIEAMQKSLEARTEAMHKLAPEMIRFYQTLTPDQQKLADDSLMPGGVGGHGRGHHHGGMMGH